MAMYPALFAALPRLNCPPAENEWLPPAAHVHALLSPLTNAEIAQLKKVENILGQSLWPMDSQLNLACAPITDSRLITSVNQIVELAWLYNVHVCADIPLTVLVSSITDPALRDALCYQSQSPSITLQHSHAWLPDYIHALQDTSATLSQSTVLSSGKTNLHAEHIVLSAIWQTCERATQGDICFESVLARYIQWHICHQRQVDYEKQSDFLKQYLSQSTSYLHELYTESNHGADQ